MVSTLPAAIGDIADHNKAVIYDLLFKARSINRSESWMSLVGGSRT